VFWLTRRSVERLPLAHVVLPHNDVHCHADAAVAYPGKGQLADLGGQVLDDVQNVAEQTPEPEASRHRGEHLAADRCCSAPKG